MAVIDTNSILKDIQEIFVDEEKGPFCSEEEFRYYFLSKIREVLNGNNNCSLEYPFKYKKKHDDHIYKDDAEPGDNVKNAKVDAILWDPKNLKHGLYAFEFKYAHGEFDDKHGGTINEQDPTVDIRYNFLEDIDRLESLFDDNGIVIDVGYAIFLTDIKAYRRTPNPNANYFKIRLSDDRTISVGEECYCTKQEKKDKQEDKAPEKINRKCYKPLIFRSEYTITWNQIDGTKFYCCIVEVKPKDK